MRPIARRTVVASVVLGLIAAYYLLPSLRLLAWALLHFGCAAAVVLGVRWHRGRFDVRSAPGQGTTIEVAMPPQITDLVDLDV